MVLAKTSFRITSLMIVFLFSIFGAFGQSRLIPHVTGVGGGFETEIIISNYSSTPQAFTLTGFSSDGAKAATISDAVLEPGTTLRTSPSDLFKTDTISHFLISEDSKIKVSVAYQAARENVGPVHVGETTTSGTVFRLFMGNTSITWDGIAVVNLGSSPGTVTIRQINDDGQELSSFQAFSNLQPNAKGLSVLSTEFDDISNSSLEIRSTQPIVLTPLRGTLDSAFLWENVATLVE